MSGDDLRVLTPFIALATTAVVVMLLAAFYRRHRAAMVVTLLGFAATGAALGAASGEVPRVVTPLLIVDGYALYFIGLIVAGGAAVVGLAYGYLERRSRLPQEFYVLLVTATLGGAVLAASRHFASFFLALELLSVPMFAMIAYRTPRWEALEAGIKYLVLAGVSSAFLVFGMAIVYSRLGTMTFSTIAADLTAQPHPDAYALAGLALILTGLAFKLSLVPFHMWVADVYEGSPAPVAAYVATVSKGAVFALLLRLVIEGGLYHYHAVVVMIASMAIASMVVGNLLALLQDKVKRMLAYSSVAHMGYLLIPLAVGGPLAVETVGFYLAAYFVMLIGAFGVVTVISPVAADRDTIADYQGLFWRRPWLAVTFTGMLLSLAGIPVTIGFFAKFYVLAAGVASASWALVWALIIASTVALYYYLRIAIALYRPLPEQQAAGLPRLSAGGGAVIATVLFLLLSLGLYPTPLIDFLHATAAVVE